MVTRSLWDMQAGDMGIVVAHDGDHQHGRRLAELGLAEGEHVEVLQDGPAMLLQLGTGTLCVRPCPDTHVTVVCP